MKSDLYPISKAADLLGVSKETLRRWDESGKLKAVRQEGSNYRFYHPSQLTHFEQTQHQLNDEWAQELEVKALRPYTLIELFAGAGGLALGLEKAGFKSVLLNELDKHACNTLRQNRPNWHVVEGDITKIDFRQYQNKIDILTGGFPCQSFSYAGKKLGFEDTRGTLFFEFARAIKEINPPIFVAENVRGLLNHEQGKTLQAIKDVIAELGYDLIEPRVLKAVFYRVPQKRERLILIGIRKDVTHKTHYKWPTPFHRMMTMRDALKAGELFDTDVPKSEGQQYPKTKAAILDKVPAGGYWRDLPEDLQRQYMMKSYFLGGGKTGIARRLSWVEPSLTLTCAPAQKQTERCHPDETRPLTVREYARIQTFPDDWQFSGPITAQYKQIGNAVPVNLAHKLGCSLIKLLNQIEASEQVEIHKKAASKKCVSD